MCCVFFLLSALLCNLVVGLFCIVLFVSWLRVADCDLGSFIELKVFDIVYEDERLSGNTLVVYGPFIFFYKVIGELCCYFEACCLLNDSPCIR